MTQSGWRKPTPALGVADQLARDGAQRSIVKTRCIIAVKRVAAHIGLKAADILLLDTLAAFSQTQDWEAGRRAIVWPSNALLMDQTGFSLSTLKRRARRLAELGLVTFCDSPNGKRWGRRDRHGVIIEGYGFDLTPLGARVDEFEVLAQELAAERALCQRLKRLITITRRNIRSRLEALVSATPAMSAIAALQCDFDHLLARLPRANAPSEVLQDMARALQSLLGQIEDATAVTNDVVENTHNTCSEACKMTSLGVNSDPHIQTTKQYQSVETQGLQNQKQINIAAAEQELPMKAGNLTSGAVKQACPEFIAWGKSLGLTHHNWFDLSKMANALRPMIGVPETGWHRARDELGDNVATAALALIFEKVHSGEVKSPAGYLRGMVKKAQSGELHLERSLMGRQNRVTT